MIARANCHLQLNRGAAHLETDFAIKSGAKIPFLQLNRGANASHFCHLRPFNPTRLSVPPEARSPSYMARTAAWKSTLAHALFRKALCI